jgi:hypothetical protein
MKNGEKNAVVRTGHELLLPDRFWCMDNKLNG